MEHVEGLLVVVEKAFSEIISITTRPAPISLAMVRKAELVTPAIGASTQRLGISTSPIIKGVLRLAIDEFLQIVFVKVVMGLAELAGDVHALVFFLHLMQVRFWQTSQSIEEAVFRAVADKTDFFF